MVISRKQIVNNPIVSINSINIERVYITTFLGVHIDCQLDWNGHIKKKHNRLIQKKSQDASLQTSLWTIMTFLLCTIDAQFSTLKDLPQRL